MVDPEGPAPNKPPVSKTVVMDDPDAPADEAGSAHAFAPPADEDESIADADDVQQRCGGDSGESRRTTSADDIDPLPLGSSPGAQATPPAATVPDAPALDKSAPAKTEIGEPPLDALSPPAAVAAPSYFASPPPAGRQPYPAAYPGSVDGYPGPYPAYPPGYPAPYPTASRTARGSSLGVILAVTGLVVLLTLIAGAIGVLFVRDYVEPSREVGPLSPTEVDGDEPSGPAEVKPDTTEPPASAAAAERGNRDEPPAAPTRPSPVATPSKPEAPPPKTAGPDATATAPKSTAPPKSTTAPESTAAPKSTDTPKSTPKRPRRPSRRRDGVTI